MTLPLWVDYSQAIGGIATAIALGFIGIQTFTSRKQTALMQEQIGRAWIGGAIDSTRRSKVRYENDRFVLRCKNYGKIVARISWTKSVIGKFPLTKSDINKRPKNPTKKIIFPDHEEEFSTNENIGIDKSTEDVEIWFGFIVRYEGNSNPGEYGIVGKYVRKNRLGSFIHLDEWFEAKRRKPPWYMSQSSLVDNNE
jgi:hypothetical protein